jgi:hypothetical protein
MACPSSSSTEFQHSPEHNGRAHSLKLSVRFLGQKRKTAALSLVPSEAAAPGSTRMLAHKMKCDFLTEISPNGLVIRPYITDDAPELNLSQSRCWGRSPGSHSTNNEDGRNQYAVDHLQYIGPDNCTRLTNDTIDGVAGKADKDELRRTCGSSLRIVFLTSQNFLRTNARIPRSQLGPGRPSQHDRF